MIKRRGVNTIVVDGWPPATIWDAPTAEGTRRLNKDQARRYEEMRKEIMMAWRGFETKRCWVRVTFVGARSKAHVSSMGQTLVLMLKGAGVIRSEGPDTVVGVTAKSRRGPIERTEITIRHLSQPLSIQITSSQDKSNVVDLERHRETGGSPEGGLYPPKAGNLEAPLRAPYSKGVCTAPLFNTPNQSSKQAGTNTEDAILLDSGLLSDSIDQTLKELSLGIDSLGW